MTTAKQGRPDVEVVIVAYGPPGPLEACLAGLGPTAAPLVVDNSSRSDTRALVESSGGRYLDPGRNLGFGAGVNYGLRHGVRQGADVLLLNPDAVLSDEGLRDLHQALHAQPRLAAVAPRQTEPDDGRPARVAWPVPTPGGAWLDAVGLGSYRKGRRQFLIGSVLLLRAEALADVGPFDERFFLYAEETDWQIRALARGWQVSLCPEVAATHVGGGTGGDPRRREMHFHASHERLIRKHHGYAGWQLYRAGVLTGTVVRWAFRRGPEAARARLRAELYLRGPCRQERLLAGSEGRPQ